MPEIGRWAVRESSGTFRQDVAEEFNESSYRWELLNWTPRQVTGPAEWPVTVMPRCESVRASQASSRSDYRERRTPIRERFVDAQVRTDELRLFMQADDAIVSSAGDIGVEADTVILDAQFQLRFVHGSQRDHGNAHVAIGVPL